MHRNSHVYLWTLFVCTSLPLTACSRATHTGILAYPAARRSISADTLHGIVVPDPYRWLENAASAEARAWVAAEDTLARGYLHATPGYAAVRAHLAALRLRASIRLPQVAGNRIFVYGTPDRVTSAGVSRTNLYVQNAPGSPMIPLIREADFPFNLVLDYRTSPDGKHVAIATRAAAGSSWMVWRIMDVERARFLADRIQGAFLLEDLAWAADGKGFFYGRYDTPRGPRDRAGLRSGHRVQYHRLGTDPADDPILIGIAAGEPDRELAITATRDGHAVLIVGRAATGHTAVWRANQGRPGAHPDVLVPDLAGSFRALGMRGRQFLFFTTLDAPRGRIVAVDPAHPEPASWHTVVPQGADVIVPGGQGQAAPLQVGRRLVVPYQRDLATRLRVYDLQGRLEREIEIPNGGLLFNGGGANPLAPGDSAHSVFYRFIGITDPVAIIRLDLDTGRTTTWFRPDLPFDPDAYETRRVFFPSTDDTRVPMSITLRRGTRLDGSAPLILYAYGADGFIMRPFYRPMFMAWIEMGGIFAIANVRGGGALGEDWHQAAIGATKEKSIDDFVAAGDWLVRHRYTRPSRLVVNGVSAGGVLPAALIVRRPHLAAAALVDYPLLDMVRYERFAGGQFRDFGSPRDTAVFHALLHYSPYANLRPGTCYPPTLVTTSDADDQVPPLHAYKFLAALQADDDCGHPMLLNMVWGSGHSAYGSSRHPLLDTMTDQLVFLLRVLHLDSPFSG